MASVLRTHSFCAPFQPARTIILYTATPYARLRCTYAQIECFATGRVLVAVLRHQHGPVGTQHGGAILGGIHVALAAFPS